MLKQLTSIASRSRATLVCASLLALSAAAPIKPDLLSGLVWRNLGPFRAGRVSAVSGAIGEVGTFYAGFPAAGVWKTTSAGETWYPVFDDIRDVSSIGAVEVAPSNPDVVYVGTGDMVTGGVINEGNGVYKSVDAGKTWKHVGLDDTKQIPSIVVNPRNPDIVLVAAQGNLYAKGTSRGVYRTTDGGNTWTKTLYVDDETGIEKLARAHDAPNVIFAATVRHYRPPPVAGAPPGGPAGAPGGAAQQGPTGTALYKSTDEGLTWKEVTGGGLPRLAGRTSVAVALHTNAQRVYLVGTFGLYRSDDGGATWRRMGASDPRVGAGQGGYNNGVYVDPANPDVVYTFNTASYKSTDGGNTFTGFKGAPGGDDPQQGWIDPTNGQRMVLGYDQGAIVTLDGGQTWSSWYNQSTEQVYHISADNSFPYWVYATQQDAGAIRTRVRGNLGAVTPVDWNPVNGWEWGTIIADPLNNNLVWASGSGVVKISYPSEQWINVSPALNPELRLRATSSAPLVFAPWNQRMLLAGFQYLMATTDAGAHWKKLSPDLGYAKGVTPPADTATPAPGALPGGVIETISASTVARGTIWVGTNNGLIKVTKDEGKTWDDASIPGLPNGNRGLVSTVDASHFDAAAAFAVVDLHGVGDYTPYVYRTRDYGKTWTRIANGLPVNQPSGSFARTIRGDPKKAGLAYVGTESGMFVSFDDGDNWQSLQLNLPNTSYREIVFKGNDLIVGTYGRGIWVLDDFAVIRQMTPAIADEPVHLFKPSDAVRVRRNVNADTPFPPEVPHAINPPDGAIVYYWLGKKSAGEVTLDVLDAAGARVRHLSSIAAAPVPEAARPPHPNFWVAPPFALPMAAGTNRTAWDLRYDDPPAFSHSFAINANPGLTPASPQGAFAPPGTYTVKLTVNGSSYTQPLMLTNDPRSPASSADLVAQHTLFRKIHGGIQAAWDGYQQVAAMRTALTGVTPTDSTSDAAKAIRAFRAKIDSVGGVGGGGRGGGRGGGGPTPPPTFQLVHGRFVSQLTAQDNGDHAPTEAMLAAYAQACRDLIKTVTAWTDVNARAVPALNAILTKNGAKAIVPAAGVPAPKCESP